MEVQQEVQQELKEFVCDVCHKQFKKKYNLQVSENIYFLIINVILIPYYFD